MNLKTVLFRIIAWLALPLLAAGLAFMSATESLAALLWKDGSFAWALAPFLLAASALLGLTFRQFRISLMALLLGSVIWSLRIFPSGTPAGMVMAYLAELFVPLAAILFLIIPEQRIFSQWGIARLCLAIFFAGMILMLPELDRVQGWFTEHPIPSSIPGVNVPLFVLITLAVLVVVAVILARPESPNVGLFFFALSLQVVLLVNANSIAVRSQLPLPELEHALCVGCGALLAWLSIDCGWRNAFIDELTQLPGRRPMRHHFASLGQEFTIASIDIDHFKKINDQYGHDVGDQVLRSIASQLISFRYGAAYRFGGEEFVVVMKRGILRDHIKMLDDLREDIAARPFVLRSRDRPSKRPSKKGTRQAGQKNRQITVTVSIGVADSEETDLPDEVLTAADKALYEAKRLGRNRVCKG